MQQLAAVHYNDLIIEVGLLKAWIKETSGDESVIHGLDRTIDFYKNALFKIIEKW